MHGIENNGGVGVHCASVPELFVASSLSLSVSVSLPLSLSLPDFDAAGRATTRLAKRCCAQNERRNAEKRNQWLEIYPFLETGNK